MSEFKNCGNCGGTGRVPDAVPEPFKVRYTVPEFGLGRPRVPDPSATLECLAESGLSHDEEIRRAAVELAIELFAASGSAGIKKTAVEINFYLRTGNWSLTDEHSPNP